MQSTVDMMRALGDTNRFSIFLMLMLRPMCVCEITAVLGTAPSTVSAHLKILKHAGLARSSKDGKWVEYALNEGSSAATSLARWVYETTRDDPEAQNVIDAARRITKEVCSATAARSRNNVLK